MRKVLLTIFIVPLVLCLTAQNTTTLKVLNYNLRFGELASLEELASYIRKHNPDIVALQEMDWNTNRSNARHQNGKDFIAELVYHTGMFGIFGKTIDYSGGYYGVGVLSRYPFVKTERILLPNPENTEQRALLITAIELPNQERINFASVHLALKEKERGIQLKSVKKHMEKYKGISMVAGDFNTTPDEDILKKNMKGWEDALPANGFTFSTYEPEVKIDYIFYKPAKKVKVIKSWIDYSTKLSDHFPCFAEFEISR